MKEIKALVPLIVVAAVLGVFIIASCEPAEGDAKEEPKVVEISHEEAMEILEEGEYIYPLTEAERDLVERVVAAEARGEDLEGMMAVAQSIRDRAITRNQSVEEVCTSPYQYAAAYTGEISDKLKDAVTFVFDKGHSPLEFPTTHFYAHEEIDAPDWTYEKNLRAVIGGHTFFG